MAGKAKPSFKSSMPKDEPYTKFPSPYGSHKSMVNEEYKFNDPKFVVCVDEHGPYLTEKNRLDSGLADPNRYRNVDLRKQIIDAVMKRSVNEE